MHSEYYSYFFLSAAVLDLHVGLYDSKCIGLKHISKYKVDFIVSAVIAA